MGLCFPRKRNSILKWGFSPEAFACLSATLPRKGQLLTEHIAFEAWGARGGNGPAHDTDAALAIPDTPGVRARGTGAVGLISKPARGWGPCCC